MNESTNMELINVAREMGSSTYACKIALKLCDRLEAADKRIAELEASLESVSADGHVHGARPCQTCAPISKTLGKPFGCDLWRQRKNNAATPTGG